MIGASQLDFTLRPGVVYLLTVAIAILLIYYFENDEVTEWGGTTGSPLCRHKTRYRKKGDG
ncbi:MAG: hypothetical protein JXA08_08605 [Methanomicrobiaceae archaeon]|nr:hypothetical protein [Methanomicrobiaceae archaeon]